MKIKELKWEDCTPTVSSNVVSRAKALGYAFEIIASHRESFDVYINGRYMCAGSPDTGKAKGFSQEWLEERIGEMVEMKAAEIQWYKPIGISKHLLGDQTRRAGPGVTAEWDYSITDDYTYVSAHRQGLICKYRGTAICWVPFTSGGWEEEERLMALCKGFCQIHKQKRLGEGA